MASRGGITDWLSLSQRLRSTLQKLKNNSSDAPHMSALAIALLLLVLGFHSPHAVLGQCGIFGACNGTGQLCCGGASCTFTPANGSASFCCGKTTCGSGELCCSNSFGDNCCQGDEQCCGNSCCGSLEKNGSVCASVDSKGVGKCESICPTTPVVQSFCSLGPSSNPTQNCCNPSQNCCTGSGHCCDSSCVDRKGASICPDSIYGDPHISLSSLIDPTKHPNVEDFSFDFHGEANRTYCMISDLLFAVTVRMFGLSADANILARPLEDPTKFFEGTWIDGIGFMYINWSGEERRVEVLLNHDADSFGDAEPFSATFGDGTRVPLNHHELDTLWTSPDGMVKISPHPTRESALSISVGESLDMDIFREFEDEIITEPPVQFLNFEIRHAATSANVHGFLGQMYAPGAVEERLAMGTLEGFLHREYVEGADEDYETSSLTSSDCAFDRFGKVPPTASDFSAVNLGRRLLMPAVSDRVPVSCRVLDKGKTFVCA